MDVVIGLTLKHPQVAPSAQGLAEVPSSRPALHHLKDSYSHCFRNSSDHFSWKIYRTKAKVCLIRPLPEL